MAVARCPPRRVSNSGVSSGMPSRYRVRTSFLKSSEYGLPLRLGCVFYFAYVLGGRHSEPEAAMVMMQEWMEWMRQCIDGSGSDSVFVGG